MEQQNKQQPPNDRLSTPSTLLFNDKIEIRVLTNIMLNNNLLVQAGNLLSAGLFHDTKNAEVFKILQKGVASGCVADNIYVATELMRNPNEKCYSGTEILDVFSEYVSDALFPQDIQLLREYAKRRRMWFVGQSLIRVGVDMSVTPEWGVKQVEKMLSEEEGDDNGPMSLKEANAVMMKRVEDNASGVSDTMLPTGFSYLDGNGGFQVDDLNVIAADSSMGKTAFAMNIATSVAGSGKPVMVYSMEMTAPQLAARINAYSAHVPSSVIQYKRLESLQYWDLIHAVEETDKLPIYFDDNSTSSVEAIYASIRRNVRKLGIKMAIVDYLQILSAVGQIREQEKFLGEVSRNFKNMAKELHINITVLSQLARNNMDPRPSTSRVRASGQIVEAADNVIMIWRPSVYGKTYKDCGAPVDGTAEIIIGKGRNIGTGSFVVHFEPMYTRFYDPTPEEAELWKTSTQNDMKDNSYGHGGVTNALPEPDSQQQIPF